MDDLQTKMDKLAEKFSESRRINLFSKAVDELREGIQLFETKMSELSDAMIRMNLQPCFAESKLIFYSNLMSTEFRRYNFGDVIQIYKEHFEICKIDMNMKKNLLHIFSSMELQYH